MKKAFLVYFDNCRQLECLSDPAYAAVWRTVTEYARRVAAGEESEDWLVQRLADLPADAAMAARFMTDNVQRDDLAYRARIEQCRGRVEPTRSRGEMQSPGAASNGNRSGSRSRRSDLSDLPSSREGRPFGAW